MRSKILLFVTAFLFTLTSQAQVLLADTAFVTDSGYNGAGASSIFKPYGRIFGINMRSPNQQVIADDFTVPAGQAWAIDTVIIYGFEDRSSTVSTFSTAYLEIDKDSVTGSVVFGDHGTNRLVKTGWTGIYRIDTAYNRSYRDTTRPIMYMKLKVAPRAVLQAGHYWLKFHANGVVASPLQTWCPPKVLPDRSNPANQNGKWASFNYWHDAVDTTAPGTATPIGFNFIILGDTVTPTAVRNVSGFTAEMRVSPNPVSSLCNLSYTLHREGIVCIDLYDVSGKKVRALTHQRLTAGSHQLTIDAEQLPAGIYSCILSTDDGSDSRRIQVVH